MNSKHMKISNFLGPLKYFGSGKQAGDTVWLYANGLSTLAKAKSKLYLNLGQIWLSALKTN